MAVTVDGPEAEVVDEVEEQDEPLTTENWVEYWNSPVPSTMINMP